MVKNNIKEAIANLPIKIVNGFAPPLNSKTPRDPRVAKQKADIMIEIRPFRLFWFTFSIFTPG
jgi:hypothetical protein